MLFIWMYDLNMKTRFVTLQKRHKWQLDEDIDHMASGSGYLTVYLNFRLLLTKIANEKVVL